MDKETVKKVIIEAFSDNQYPGDDNIAAHKRDLANEDLSFFVGVDWRDIDVDFMRKVGDTDNFFFMTPQAFVYYLPALMLVCMEVLESDSTLPGSIVFKLTFSEAKLDDYVILLSSKQALAIRLFLQYLLNQYKPEDEPYADDVRDTLDIYWQNFQINDTVILRRFNENIASIKERISKAFACNQYPGDDNIFKEQIDRNSEISRAFIGLRWQDVDFELANKLDSNFFAQLTPEAFVYYMPAFLILALEQYANPGQWLEHFLGHLICDKKTLPDFFPLLTDDQYWDIWSYALSFIIENDSINSNKAEQAKDSLFWCFCSHKGIRHLSY